MIFGILEVESFLKPFILIIYFLKAIVKYENQNN